MEGILGKKVGITRIFDEKGKSLPVTIIEAGPCTIIQKKTRDSQGYEAIQMGFGRKKKVSKPLAGHFARAKAEPGRFLKEFRVEKVEAYEVGSQVKVDIFKPGDYLDVVGISKGRGFAGVMKRWGFSGGPASHGAHGWHRRPGSIGQATYPGRVFKGKKMPGRMGTERVTIQNLEVVKVESQENLLLVKGSVPGAKGGLLLLKKAIKKKGASPPSPQESEKEKAGKEKSKEKPGE
jgi:large subunit ribosomal protein L3